MEKNLAITSDKNLEEYVNQLDVSRRIYRPFNVEIEEDNLLDSTEKNFSPKTNQISLNIASENKDIYDQVGGYHYENYQKIIMKMPKNYYEIITSS